MSSKGNCHACGKEILEKSKSIETFGSHFHEECWQCMRCHKVLGETYFPITGESGKKIK